MDTDTGTGTGTGTKLLRMSISARKFSQEVAPFQKVFGMPAIFCRDDLRECLSKLDLNVEDPSITAA